MRIGIVTITLLVATSLQLLFALPAKSQPIDKVEITLGLNNETLVQAFQKIEAQSPFHFMYRNKEVKHIRNLKVKSSKQSVEDLLRNILAGTSLTYRQVNNQILIIPAKRGFQNPSVLSIPGYENLQYVPVANIVTGRVSNSKGEPLVGVSITVKGATTGTSTDAQGHYSIDVPANGTLVFSYVGYAMREITVKGRSSVDVVLEESVSALDQVVVVGYGTQKRSSVTGAIATMNGGDIANMPVTQLSNGLAGRLSGVFVNQSSGAPGYAASIQVRSVNTWKSSGNDPLYVINGIISTKQFFDALDPIEIKSITVLKDAASASVYGARGGNGVILVTTNTGHEGKFKLSYDYLYSFDRPSNLPKYVSAKDMVRLANYAFTSIGLDPEYGPTEVAYFNTHDPARALFTDIYRNPETQKNSVSASGGSGKVQYFLSGSVMNQYAFVKNADYKKYNFRSNINVEFTKNLSGYFDVSFHNSTKRRFVMQEDNQAGFEEDPTFGKFWSRIQYLQPYAAPKTSDGKLINPGWIGNAMGFVEEGGMNTANDYNINPLMHLNYKVPFLEGLSVSANYSPQFYIREIKHYEKKQKLYTVKQEGEHGFIYTDSIISSSLSSFPSKERLAKTNDRKLDYQLNLSADYSHNFGKHHIGAMFNTEISEGTDNYFYAVRENFPLVQRDQFWATGVSRTDSYVDGSEYQSGRMSYIGRLTYQYADKYYMNASLRRDGSMLFAPGYRWGNFPAVSLGWILSNEDFMKKTFFDYLKLRGSWGLTGNDVVGGFKWQDTYSAGGGFMIGTVMAPTVIYNGIPNASLTWEKTREFDIGLDSRFLNGFIFNFDFFQRHTYDILDSRIVSLPVSFGGNLPPVNYGIVDGHGIEFEVGYSGHTGEFNYEVKGNLSYAQNKVVLKDVPQNVRDVNNPNGRSTDYVVALLSKGIIRTQAELDAVPANYTAYGLAPRLGDVWYEDISGPNGKPDGIIDDYDQQVIKGKHYLPPYTYGLNMTGTWKNISLNLFFQGVIGVSKMYDADYAYHRKFVVYARPSTNWLDSWSPDNPNASFPRPDVWGNSSNDYPSTFWLKNGDYLRLGLLSLSYSLPRSILNKLNISNASLMLSGTNLFTISGFKYYDPAIPSMSSYPTMKTYSLGVNVSF